MSNENTELMDVRQLADSLGVEYHHLNSADTIRSLIAEQQAVKQMEGREAAPKAAPEVIINTKEQISEAISRYLENENFNATFDGTTWAFECRGSQDSGSLSVPLSVIVRKAGVVVRGARSPRGFTDGQDPRNISNKVIWA